MGWCWPVTESADQKYKISELRWYRGTPVVLILDEACFCFALRGRRNRQSKGLKTTWSQMQSMTFRELSDQLVTLYNERKFDDALRLIEEQREFFPEQATRITFWRMCLLSLAGRSTEVLLVFQQGLDSGQWWSRELFADPDLDAVRDLPEFQRLVAISEERVFPGTRPFSCRSRLPQAAIRSCSRSMVAMGTRNLIWNSGKWRVCAVGWWFLRNRRSLCFPALIAGTALPRAWRMSCIPTNRL
jgi:hypothetical protein